MRHPWLILLLVALFPAPAAGETPCEAYSASAAVFVGVAGAPVTRSIQFLDQPAFELTVTPVRVDRAYIGAPSSVMYVTPLSVQTYAVPGGTYLFYGRAYGPPDVVMASPGFGAKPIEQAAEDLAFLDALPPSGAGGVISGTVQRRDDARDRSTTTRVPIAGVPVRVFNDTQSAETVADAGGNFIVAGLPAGAYHVLPTLPEDLAVADTTGYSASVRDGGCATTTVDVVVNGRVRGVLRGPDGRPLQYTSVDLMPMDVAPDRGGHVRGTGSVSTDAFGQFEFDRRPPGRYYLGVSLYNPPNPNGPSYPRTYYPGTTERAAALPVVIGRATASDGFDFSIATVLAKGELQVVVENDLPGQLRVCLTRLGDIVTTSSRWSVQPAVPLTVPVVDGQRYEVHVHLESAGGHLESEPVVFTGTARRSVVRLHPDIPRALHP